MVQSLRAATECEVDLARKRPGRAIGLRPWIPKQSLEYCSCAAEPHPLTRTSPCEVHGVDADSTVVIRKRIGRTKILKFFADLPPCLVGMEACATSHQWARQLKKLGHDVRLMPPTYVKAYVKRSKNDAADAAAICEAVTRPSMRFANQERRAAERADAAPNAGPPDPSAHAANQRTSCPPGRARAGGSKGARRIASAGHG
jgi:hypothetical protein